MGRKVIKAGKKKRQAVIEVHDTILVAVQWGWCKICHQHRDLRCGACYRCSPRVDGRPIMGGHEFWDKKNVNNRWKVMDQ